MEISVEFWYCLLVTSEPVLLYSLWLGLVMTGDCTNPCWDLTNAEIYLTVKLGTWQEVDQSPPTGAPTAGTGRWSPPPDLSPPSSSMRSRTEFWGLLFPAGDTSLQSEECHQLLRSDTESIELMPIGSQLDTGQVKRKKSKVRPNTDFCTFSHVTDTESGGGGQNKG